jgi:hypothetical protein
MAQSPIYEIDADGTIRTDVLHWEGFPRILWETLSEVGYTMPPLYEVVSFWDQGVPYARTIATVLPHLEHPEWADLSMMFFAHRGVESVESAAMRILHTFCEQHPDEVMLTTLGLFPAMDPLDSAWRERISLTNVLLTMDPPEGRCAPASEVVGGGVQHAGVSSFHSGYALSCVDGLHSDEGYPHPRPSV